MDRRIVAAAVEIEGIIISTPRPGRHHNVLHALHALGVKDHGPDVQGFLTNEGKFVSREIAYWIAKDAGQIVHKTPPEDILFSEDIW